MKRQKPATAPPKQPTQTLRAQSTPGKLRGAQRRKPMLCKEDQGLDKTEPSPQKRAGSHVIAIPAKWISRLEGKPHGQEGSPSEVSRMRDASNSPRNAKRARMPRELFFALPAIAKRMLPSRLFLLPPGSSLWPAPEAWPSCRNVHPPPEPTCTGPLLAEESFSPSWRW